MIVYKGPQDYSFAILKTYPEYIILYYGFPDTKILLYLKAIIIEPFTFLETSSRVWATVLAS